MKDTNFFDAYENGIAISYSVPRGYKGPWYSILAPNEKLMKGYKQGYITWEEYERAYKLKLRALDKEAVLRDLIKFYNGLNFTLLCWCHDRRYCHRRLVIEWLNE